MLEQIIYTVMTLALTTGAPQPKAKDGSLNGPSLCEKIEPKLTDGIYIAEIKGYPVLYQVLDKGNICILMSSQNDEALYFIDDKCEDYLDRVQVVVNWPNGYELPREAFKEDAVRVDGHLKQVHHHYACEKNKRTIEELEQMVTEPNGEKK